MVYVFRACDMKSTGWGIDMENRSPCSTHFATRLSSVALGKLHSSSSSENNPTGSPKNKSSRDRLSTKVKSHPSVPIPACLQSSSSSLQEAGTHAPRVKSKCKTRIGTRRMLSFQDWWRDDGTTGRKHRSAVGGGRWMVNTTGQENRLRKLIALSHEHALIEKVAKSLICHVDAHLLKAVLRNAFNGQDV